jgi:hypothetical protein
MGISMDEPEENIMKHNTANTIMSAKERYLVEDSLVEKIDVQRQSEVLSSIQADDAKASSANGEDDAAGAGKAEKNDEFMEAVKTFIRGIDISTL